MVITETNLEGCFIIEPAVFNNERGIFFESFNQKIFEEKTGLKVNFIQDNQSISQRGALRGLHLQKGEFAQSKLVRVIKGRVLDVAVDLREDSKTFGQHVSIILSGKQNVSFYIPEGFAHGFCALENNTIMHYKCTNYRDEKSELGIIWNDPKLNIKWPIKKPIISKKDKKNLNFEHLMDKL